MSQQNPYDSSGGDPSPTTSSWIPVDFEAILDALLAGTLTRPTPTIGKIDAQAALFYRGKVNGVAGESGSGKTWTALAACAQELVSGEHTVFIDMEDDAAAVIARLLDMHVDPDAIRARFVYLNPSGSLDPEGAAKLVALLHARRPTLVVIDSTGEGLALDGANPNADEEVARWFRRLPAMLAATAYGDEPGPAVLVLDHQSKDGSGSMWPIGSQRKRAAISGAQYVQEAVSAFAKGHRGYAVIKCAKDRHGTYRAAQRVARLTVTPDDDGVLVQLGGFHDADHEPGEAFRPTGYMERISRALELVTAPVSFNGVVERVEGKRAHVRTALDVLVSEGYVTTTSGPRGSILHTLASPYREPVEPETGSKRLVTGSGSLSGEPGTSHITSSGTQLGTGGNQWSDPGYCAHGMTAGKHCGHCGGTAVAKAVGHVA